MELLGFVNLGEYTPEKDRDSLGDHALVLMFQPFAGKSIQALGCFLSKGNVTGAVQAKLVLECILHCENAGLYIDAVTSDGAAWNRSMWKEFGIEDPLRPWCVHPVDKGRLLRFASDWPHLIKCLRNLLISKKEFILFSNSVALALRSYANEVPGLFDSEPTSKFCERVNKIIDIMNSSLPSKALKYDSEDYKHFFGMMRAAGGCNNHAESLQIGQIFRLMSLYSLVKPPRGSNISGGEMLKTLISVNDNENAVLGIDKKTKFNLTFNHLSDDNESMPHVETFNDNNEAFAYVCGYLAKQYKKIECDEFSIVIIVRFGIAVWLHMLVAALSASAMCPILGPCPRHGIRF
ncbi:hypothetical protein TcasGA2_TC016158 [Tribolium castaneum]|uniref:Transposable element P transposase-like Protein n=1 Tax=Tribolium castaneum TaxID=7070 RepID=D6WBH6_TRICA|nr:hypothetical protein TcasGA2_TC016158 [Tribolium castaneum]